MKLHIKQFCVLILICVCLFCSCVDNRKKLEESIPDTQTSPSSIIDNKKEKPILIGEDEPITRSIVSKMLSLTFSNLSEIDATKREINFSDTNKEKWFDKYINFAYKKNLLKGYNDKFKPDDYLTVSEAQYIIDKIDSTNKIKLNLTENTKDKAISYNLWIEIYMKILKNLSNNNIKNKFNIIAKKSVILATPKTNNLLKNNYVLTDKEIIKSTGIDLSEYVNKEISYWTKDNEIIALSSVTSNNPTIKNVYFLDETNNDILCFIGGLESSYKKADNLEITNNKTKIATITFEDNKIKKINFTTEVKEEQIATITDNKVKTVKNEIFDIDPDYKVYYIKNNKIMLGKKEDLVEGKTYELYITDKKINAFVFTKL